jgi:hypothetical protein
MMKRDIKVVKRGTKSAPTLKTAEETLTLQQKSAADEERDMVDSVKGWISEHAENSKAKGKKSESDRQVWESGDSA